jgi:hypothetical protein
MPEPAAMPEPEMPEPAAMPEPEMPEPEMPEPEMQEPAAELDMPIISAESDSEINLEGFSVDEDPNQCYSLPESDGESSCETNLSDIFDTADSEDALSNYMAEDTTLSNNEEPSNEEPANTEESSDTSDNNMPEIDFNDMGAFSENTEDHSHNDCGSDSDFC